jgi:hypothetical protein
MIIAKVPVPILVLWPTIVVAVSVFCLASIDLLSCVSANVYGFSTLVGYSLSTAEA